MEKMESTHGIIPENVQRKVYESLDRLHIEYIDLINVHDVEFSDMNQVVNETLPALVELKKERYCGTCRYHRLAIRKLKMDH